LAAACLRDIPDAHFKVMKRDPESARLFQLQLMRQSFDIQDRLRTVYPQKDYGIVKVSRREYKHPADSQIVIVGEMPDSENR
jgi:hypothetical protein